MKLQPLLIALTALNVCLLGATLLRASNAGEAQSNDILRGKGLEIVDDQGRVRASIQLLPAAREKDGSMSAETVLLRLITEKGRPAVKIGTSEEQSGMALIGPTGTSNTYVQVLSGRTDSKLVLKNENGREQTVAP